MNIKTQYGIDQLLFGMKTADVEKLCGKPDREFRDDEDNTIWLYNNQRLRLTFYADEDFRLGYFISTHPELQLAGVQLIGAPVHTAKQALEATGIRGWEHEDFDLAENHFNEAHWLTLQAEFGHITKVELGAIIKDQDDFDWKFPAK